MSKEMPTEHEKRAAKILARRNLPHPFKQHWIVYVGTVSGAWLAFHLAWKDFKRAVKKDIRSWWK